MATVRLNRATIQVETTEMAQKFVRQVMYEVEFQAKIRAAHGPYSAGILASSITSTGPHTLGSEVSGRVGTPLHYAASVESGAKIHNIFPKRAPHIYRFGGQARRPMLRFFWRKAGRVVYMAQVPGSPGKIGRSHPGQKGKHFLRESLLDAARRHGMRIVVYDL